MFTLSPSVHRIARPQLARHGSRRLIGDYGTRSALAPSGEAHIYNIYPTIEEAQRASWRALATRRMPAHHRGHTALALRRAIPLRLRPPAIQPGRARGATQRRDRGATARQGRGAPLRAGVAARPLRERTADKIKKKQFVLTLAFLGTHVYLVTQSPEREPKNAGATQDATLFLGGGPGGSGSGGSTAISIAPRVPLRGGHPPLPGVEMIRLAPMRCRRVVGGPRHHIARALSGARSP